jgi:ABC-2 type transport system permease protein
MNILYIAYYTAIRYLRNIMCILFFTVAPILMIYSTTSGGGMSYEKLGSEFSEKIGYYAVEKSELVNQFNEVIKSGSQNGKVEITDITSYETGMDQLKKGKIDSFIYIDKAASDNYAKGSKTEIKVFGTRAVSAAKIMAEGFADNANAVSTVINMGGTPAPAAPSRNLDVTVISPDGKMPKAGDAATLGNILMFLFYGALLGSYSIINDVIKNTTLRFRSAPIRYFENITGKSLGNILMMSVSAVVVILFSKYGLNVNWNGNMLVIIPTLILYLLIINNIGVIIAGFTKNIYLCGLIAFALNFFLVYGVMVEAYAPGKGTTLDIGNSISPHFYAYKAIIGSIYSSSGANAQLSLIILAMGAVLTTAVSFIVGRRRLA